MATDEHALREHLIAQTTINIPKAFLEEFNSRLGRAYDEQFAQVQSDPTTLAEQKASKLISTRCFRDVRRRRRTVFHGVLGATERLRPPDVADGKPRGEPLANWE